MFKPEAVRWLRQELRRGKLSRSALGGACASGMAGTYEDFWAERANNPRIPARIQT